ncbi:MAG: hypothetical protein AB7T03_06075 [Bacilli bacterium]
MAKCNRCKNTIYSSQKYCGNCGKELSASDFSTNQYQGYHAMDKGYNSSENRMITILLLIFVYPVGLIYMWVTRPFTKTTRIIISTILLGMAFLGLLLIIIWTSLPGYQGFISLPNR